MIRLASPDIRESDIKNVVDVLKSGNLVQGQYVEEFEKRIIRFSKIQHCAMVSSGTAALHLSMMALGIKPGDWVIAPAFTFPATVNAVELTGANILLCDVDPIEYVIQPEQLEKVILENSEKSIKAVIVVHEFGFPAQVKKIASLAKKYNLFLIEDSACAFGTVADGYHTGHYSDMACFSFHPRKALTTGEGGAVISNNEKLVEDIKCLRNHGIKNINGSIDFIKAGLNYRMTDFQAALGIGQIDRFTEEVNKRKFLVQEYLGQLAGVKQLDLPVARDGHTWQSFMVVLKEHVDRKLIIDELFKAGIQANLGAQAIHMLTYFKSKYGFSKDDFKVASRLYNYGLVLPVYSKLSSDDISFISATLRSILEKNYA